METRERMCSIEGACGNLEGAATEARGCNDQVSTSASCLLLLSDGGFKWSLNETSLFQHHSQFISLEFVFSCVFSS